MKVYQVVELKTQTVGHGSTAEIAIVASRSAYSVHPYPLFKTKEAAEEYFKESISFSVTATLIELTLE
jgi:hypothetical protein